MIRYVRRKDEESDRLRPLTRNSGWAAASVRRQPGAPPPGIRHPLCRAQGNRDASYEKAEGFVVKKDQPLVQPFPFEAGIAVSLQPSQSSSQAVQGVNCSMSSTNRFFIHAYRPFSLLDKSSTNLVTSDGLRKIMICFVSA